MKKKFIIIFLAIILLIGGVTYAIFTWNSNNTNVSFNIEGCKVIYNAGVDIRGFSLGPALTKDDTENVISKNITMTPECGDVTVL